MMLVGVLWISFKNYLKKYLMDPMVEFLDSLLDFLDSNRNQQLHISLEKVYLRFEGM